jgi:IS30 family transposase
MDLFKKDCPPDQTAGRLKRDCPENPEMRVSHEAIYQYLYREMSGQPELKSHISGIRVRTGVKGAGKKSGADRFPAGTE